MKYSIFVSIGAVQKFVNLVDLIKSFQTSIYLQTSASMQKRTSLVKSARSLCTDPSGGTREMLCDLAKHCGNLAGVARVIQSP